MENSLERGAQSKALTAAVTFTLAYQSIGVVYGDIGTSPLYVFSSVFTSITPRKQDVLGALSLIIYTLILLPFLKYVLIVLQANDNGEGGTFALYSLICRHAKVSLVPNQNSEDRKLRSFLSIQLDRPRASSSLLRNFLEKSRSVQLSLLIVALLGTTMVIGDGVLTPCISVLSAFSGIKVQATHLSDNVTVGLSIVVLVLLFALQRYGTARVGFIFAPVIILWLAFVALVGIYNIVVHDPSVLRAFNPKYMYTFLQENKKEGWLALGGVILCITGTEAMFADLGHFSVKAIQISFTGYVLPCLLCAYTGQAAYLMKHPEDVAATFYKSIPGPVYWPIFIVAVAASVVASQAMISATFSIVKQSMALGCFPRVKVIHTSSNHIGQVYIPELNWFLMVACVLVTVIFKTSTSLGNAYGICVVAVMVVTTTLMTLIMAMIWQKHVLLAAGFFLIFGSVELLYFSSVLSKFTQGGWFPLLIAVVFLTITLLWYYGNLCKNKFEVQSKVSSDWINSLGPNLGKLRAPGIALIHTELPHGVPLMFMHLLSNLPALHSVLVFVCIKHLPVTTVLSEERFVFRRLGPQGCGMYRCLVRYGYRDSPKDDKYEELLYSGLVDFIRTSFQEAKLEQEARAQEIQEVQQPDAQVLSVLEEIPTLTCEQEVETLERGRQAGVVFIFGNKEIVAKDDCNILKRIAINKGYSFLKNNSRKSSVTLSVPQSQLLEVGMVYQV